MKNVAFSVNTPLTPFYTPFCTFLLGMVREKKDLEKIIGKSLGFLKEKKGRLICLNWESRQ